jgi:hypothetical protein
MLSSGLVIIFLSATFWMFHPRPWLGRFKGATLQAVQIEMCLSLLLYVLHFYMQSLYFSKCSQTFHSRSYMASHREKTPFTWSDNCLLYSLYFYLYSSATFWTFQFPNYNPGSAETSVGESLQVLKVRTVGPIHYISLCSALNVPPRPCTACTACHGTETHFTRSDNGLL